MASDTPEIPSSSQQTPVPAGGVRKLAAIMFTDVKDFSKKMEHNETATMHMLEIHNRMMREVVTKHEGNVIKTVGDAFLVSFESVVHATQCAIDAQENFYNYNKGKSAEELITVRIGVHVGDIIVKDKDVFGEGVNIAARIQPLAEPGGVSISEDVVRQLRGKFDVPFLRLGTGQLKNIQLPVVLYKVILPWETSSLPALQRFKFVFRQRKTKFVYAIIAVIVLTGAWFFLRTSLLKPSLTEGDKSLAVLPFTNVGDQESEYLADGITEDLIGEFSRIPHLLTISKTSSFTYKGSKLPDSTIAGTLNVRFLLKGTLQLTSGKVKFVAILSDSKTGEQVLNETLDIQRSEIFQNEKPIVAKIAEYFDLELTKTDQSSRNVSSDAYDVYLKGLFHAKKSGKDNNALAIEYFSESLTKYPEFVSAMVSLADVQILRYENEWDKSDKLLTEAKQHCDDALRLDQTNAKAIALSGAVEVLKGNQSKGLELFQNALKIDQNNSVALERIAILYLFNLNEPAKAITYFKKRQEIEPTSAVIHSNIGVGYALLKNYPEAIKSFRRALQLSPDDDGAWRNLGYLYERQAQYDSAISCYQIALQKNTSFPLTYELLVSPMLAFERYAEAESILIKGTTLMPSSHELVYLLGVTYALSKKSADAKRILQEGVMLMDEKVRKNPNDGDYYAYSALFNARLGNTKSAIDLALKAYPLDSLNNEVVIKIARTYAITGQKDNMLEWFRRAKAMNPEYDLAYLTTAIDFESFRKDEKLVFIAKQE